MDRVRAMEVFIAVAEAESFAGAARTLSISPPSVTRIIGDLEADLGVALFHRTTRVVTLTDVGHGYLDDAKRILAELEAADNSARGALSTPKGTLRLTAPTLFGQMYISPVVLDFLDRHAEASVDALFIDRVVNLVEEGIDIAARIGDLPDSSGIATRVGTVRWCVCGTPSYFERFAPPQTPGELASHRTIAVGPVGQNYEWRFDEDRVRLHPRAMFSSVQAALSAAVSGWGLVRALSYQTAPYIENGSLVPVLETYAPAPLPIHLLRSPGRYPSATVRAFWDLAVKTLRQSSALNAP